MTRTLAGIASPQRRRLSRIPRLMLWLSLGLAGLAGVAALWLHRPDLPRAELEARWAAPPSRFVTLDGVRLHLRDTGPRDAPAILLLHGFGSSLHTWEEVAERLQDRFRVLRVDLPGFGLTGPDPSGDYSDRRAHRLIAALLDELGLARVALGGSSMGGRIAWSFAAAEPGRVSHLVLLAPDGFASPGIAYGQAPRVPPLMRLLPYTLPDAPLRGGLAPAYADPASLTPALFARYRDMMLAPGVRRAILQRMAQHVLVPPEPLLARIRAPTLLLWGDQDRMVPLSNAQDYLRALPDARLVVLRGIGHVPMEEDPAAVAGALRGFLAEPR